MSALPETKERPGIVKRAEWNALLEFLRPYAKIQGGGGIRVSVAKENIRIDNGSDDDSEAEAANSTGSSPVPGYSEREVILCNSGDPETVTILVKDSVS
jgi:hypothetical protein